MVVQTVFNAELARAVGRKFQLSSAMTECECHSSRSYQGLLNLAIVYLMLKTGVVRKSKSHWLAICVVNWVAVGVQFDRIMVHNRFTTTNNLFSPGSGVDRKSVV